MKKVEAVLLNKLGRKQYSRCRKDPIAQHFRSICPSHFECRWIALTGGGIICWSEALGVESLIVRSSGLDEQVEAGRLGESVLKLSQDID